MSLILGENSLVLSLFFNIKMIGADNKAEMSRETIPTRFPFQGDKSIWIDKYNLCISLQKL